MTFRSQFNPQWKALCLFGISVLTVRPLASQTCDAGCTQFVNVVNAAITALTATLGSPSHPVVYSGNLVFANGAVVDKASTQVLLNYVDGLKAAGVQRIDLNPGYTSINDPVATANYDAVVRHIRELGLQLSLNPEVNTLELGRGATFQDYQTTAMETFPKLAARYHPDNFVIIHEPTTMDARMGDVQTAVADWDGFIKAIAPLIKQASPHTRLGAGGFQNGALSNLSQQENAYFQDFATIPDLDFLTMDIYNFDTFPTYISWAQLAHSKGKAAYIEETWLPAYLPNPLPSNAFSSSGFLTKSLDDLSIMGALDPVFADLDVAWLKGITLFAAANQLEGVTAFTTQAFFAYGTSGADKASSPGYTSVATQAIVSPNPSNPLTSTGIAFQSDSKQWGLKEVTNISSASYATLASAFNPNCGSVPNPCNAQTNLAADTLVSAFGLDLATTTALDGSFPTSLGGTTVTIVDSSNASYAAPIYYVTSGQVNYYVPAAVKPGPATVTITSGDGTQTTGVILISPVAPGLYTANANGQGPPAALAVCAGTCSGWSNRQPNGQFIQNAFSCGGSAGGCQPVPLSVVSGDTVVLELYGTGLRHVASNSALTAQIVNGPTLPVLFVGAQGDTGLDQLNVQIPSSLAGSGEVSLVLVAQDPVNNISRMSNTVTLNIR